MGFSPEMCRRGRNDRRLKSFEPKPRFRDSCHNGVFGAGRYLDCRNPCDRMIRRPTKKRRGMCNCPCPCTKWDVTMFFASSFGSERYLCRVHRRFPALCHAQPFFLWNIAIPPQAADSWRWDGMSEMKKTLTRMVTTLSKCGISISKFSRKVVQNILSCEKIQSNVPLLQPEVHQMQPLPLRCTNYHPIPSSAMDIPPCKITIPFTF